MGRISSVVRKKCLWFYVLVLVLIRIVNGIIMSCVVMM